MAEVEVRWGKGARWRKGSHYSVLNRWLDHSAALATELLDYSGQIHPFHDNENSAVGLLVAGAARAGFLPLTEYRLRKRSWHDGRKWQGGRADLWFCTAGKAYSFEFKYAKATTTRANLEWKMYWADRDIARVPRSESDHAFSGVIAPIGPGSRDNMHERFATEVDFWCVLSATDAFTTYLFFNQKC